MKKSQVLASEVEKSRDWQKADQDALWANRMVRLQRASNWWNLRRSSGVGRRRQALNAQRLALTAASHCWLHQGTRSKRGGGEERREKHWDPTSTNVSVRTPMASEGGRVREGIGLEERWEWKEDQLSALRDHRGRPGVGGGGTSDGKERITGRWSLPRWGPVVMVVR